MDLAVIGFFGILGVISRFGLDQFFSSSNDFPVGIFVINALGSLLAGLIFYFANQKMWIPSNWSVPLMVGFCGGFTTFSTYSLQSYQLIQAGKYALAGFYFVGSPLVGLAGVTLGICLPKLIWS